jgi:hypothetical protein
MIFLRAEHGDGHMTRIATLLWPARAGLLLMGKSIMVNTEEAKGSSGFCS